MSLLTTPVGGCIGYLQHNQVSDAGQLENRLGGSSDLPAEYASRNSTVACPEQTVVALDPVSNSRRRRDVERDFTPGTIYCWAPLLVLASRNLAPHKVMVRLLKCSSTWVVEFSSIRHFRLCVRYNGAALLMLGFFLKENKLCWLSAQFQSVSQIRSAGCIIGICEPVSIARERAAELSR